MRKNTTTNGTKEVNLVMSEGINVTQSSGNVSADTSPADAAQDLVKIELAARICEIIAERKLSQVCAASIMGVNQPKVSALVSGSPKGFSSDRLFRFLNSLDMDVDIIIKPKKQEAEHGCVRVVVD